MRADRLLSILLLLQVRQRVTARELARRLEVSTRTIYRDMDALSGAGILSLMDLICADAAITCVTLDGLGCRVGLISNDVGNDPDGYVAYLANV